MNLQSKKKLLILDPTRGKLYTAKQDSAELFGQRATYILSLSDSFHYHFMSFLLKGFLQILSSLARKSRKKSIQPFLCTLLFHVMTKLESKGRRKLWPKSFAKPLFFFFMCTMCNKFSFHTENERQTCKNIQAFLIHSMHLLHH